MNLKAILALFLFLTCSLQVLAARTEIKVGAYDWPPYVIWKKGHPTGLILNYVNILNRNQNQYKFVVVETSPNRRYEDLYKNHFDIIFFESIDWEWDKKRVIHAYQHLHGGEIFIAKKGKNRTQTFFHDLKNKSIRGFVGYNYAFLNFSTSPQDLKKWNVEMTNSHDGNIQAVLEGRADLAIVSYEYINLYLKKKPLIKNELIFSTKMDHVYEHSAIALHKGKINLKDMSALLLKIKSDPDFKKLL